jgi:hypothetical protein
MSEKSIIRMSKDSGNPYVMINRNCLNNKNLSWKAKGLLSYLLSMPDDWQIYLNELTTHSKDGRDSTASAIKELINNNYIKRERKRDKGKISGYIYTVYEAPYQNVKNEQKTEYGKPEYGKTVNGKTVNGKPDATNNDLTYNDLTNNNLSNISPLPPKKIDYENIKNTFNKICASEKIPKIRAINKDRKSRVKSFIKFLKEENTSLEEFYNLVKESDYLNGHVNGWAATFDWLIKPVNRIKVLEGNYRNKSFQKQTTSEMLKEMYEEA